MVESTTTFSSRVNETLNNRTGEVRDSNSSSRARKDSGSGKSSGKARAKGFSFRLGKLGFSLVEETVGSESGSGVRPEELVYQARRLYKKVERDRAAYEAAAESLGRKLYEESDPSSQAESLDQSPPTQTASPSQRKQHLAARAYAALERSLDEVRYRPGTLIGIG